jgi:hypothetical protein
MSFNLADMMSYICLVGIGLGILATIRRFDIGVGKFGDVVFLVLVVLTISLFIAFFQAVMLTRRKVLNGAKRFVHLSIWYPWSQALVIAMPFGIYHGFAELSDQRMAQYDGFPGLGLLAGCLVSAVVLNRINAWVAAGANRRDPGSTAPDPFGEDAG